MKANPFSNFLSRLFFIIFLFSLCKLFLVESVMISVPKQDNVQFLNGYEGTTVSSSVVKNYCVISERNGDDDTQNGESKRIECSKVSGPIIRIEMGTGNYLKLDSVTFIAPSEFCVIDRSIARFNPSSLNYGKLCPSHAEAPLWRKCCGDHQVLDKRTLKCHRSRSRFRPKVEDSWQSFIAPFDNSTENTFGASCPRGLSPKIYAKDPCLRESSGSFQLAPNGTPMYEASTGVFLRKTQMKPVEHRHYCVDGLLDFSVCGRGEDDKCHNGGMMGEVMLVCLEEQEPFVNEGDDEKGVPKAYFLAAIWLSTCPLLVSAAFANSLIIQRNVHGWILTSYLLSMFFVNVNSVVLILDIGTKSESGCGPLDFSMKFIYMSTLCWMTSMNFGLWRTFSSAIPQVVGPQRFLLSAVFSLGFPIFAVVVSYYVGSSPDGESGESSSSTACLKKACALYSYKTLPYYSGPIIFLVLSNFAVFLKTSTTIASLRRETEAVLHKQTRDHLESFTLFAKLFLLTGSIWVIRVILLGLQIQGLYLTWYGVVLEAVFSIPEAVFPMIIFHHPEFIKWTWHKSPMISRLLLKCNPFCKSDLFKELNSLELRSSQRSSAKNNNTSLEVNNATGSLQC